MHQHTCLWSIWREVYTIGCESYWDKANSMDCVISSQSSLHAFFKKYTINHYWLGNTSILHVHRVSTLLKSVESYIMKSFRTVLTELCLQSVKNDMRFNPNSCSKQLNLFPWSLSEFYSSRGGHKNNEAHTLGWWKWDMGAAKYDPVPTIPLRARRLPSVHHWWHQYQAAIAAASISNWTQPANVPPSWASPCPWGSWSKISVRVFSNSLCGSKGSIMSSKGTSYRPKCHF